MLVRFMSTTPGHDRRHEDEQEHHDVDDGGGGLEHGLAFVGGRVILESGELLQFRQELFFLHVAKAQEEGVVRGLLSKQGFIIGGAHDHEPADVVFEDAGHLHRGGLGPVQGDIEGAPYGQIVFLRQPPLDQDALVRGSKGLSRLPVVQTVHALDGGDVPHIQLAHVHILDAEGDIAVVQQDVIHPGFLQMLLDIPGIPAADSPVVVHDAVILVHHRLIDGIFEGEADDHQGAAASTPRS